MSKLSSPESPSVHPLLQAIEIVGLVNLARALDVTHQAVRKWQAGGRMPRTEWTGETTYCDTIERLTSGVVTKAMLLDKWPAWVPPTRATRCEGSEALQQVAP